MPASPLWNTHGLWEQLAALLPGLHVEVLERADSTNTTVLDRIRMRPSDDADAGAAAVHRSIESQAFGRRASDVQPCLLVAEQQTAGRGRQGRAWQARPGASLTFSLALPLRAADWSGLSLAVGVALAEAIEPEAPAGGRMRVGLKWPNDLWLMDELTQGRKLGGILVETVSAGAHRIAVIGIGLNVAPMALDDAGSGYACLQELLPDITPPLALHRVAPGLAAALKQFERSGFAPFALRFAARDILRGRTIRTTQVDLPEGVAQGVAENGALLVKTPTGLHGISSGEVSVRADSPTAGTTGGSAC